MPYYPPPTYNSDPLLIPFIWSWGGGRNKRTHGPDGAMIVPFIYTDFILPQFCLLGTTFGKQTIKTEPLVECEALQARSQWIWWPVRRGGCVLQLLEIVSIESARGISRSPAENLNLSNLAPLPRHRSVQSKCGPEPDLESMLEKYLHRNPKIFSFQLWCMDEAMRRLATTVIITTLGKASK